MRYLRNFKKDLSKEICLLRADFNISETELRKQYADLRRNLRLTKILPSVHFLLRKQAKIVILSHRGRPLNIKNPAFADASAGKQKYFSLRFIANFLTRELKRKVNFIPHFDFQKIAAQVKKAPSKSIFLLENLRFLPGEETNDADLAKKLASLGTLYVNDAFAVSHRKNASLAAIARFLPSFAGLLLEEEIKNLSKAMTSPKRPLVFILGGAKISDKIGLIKSFLNKADYFLIGGGIANTLLAAKGIDVNGSLFEPQMLALAKQLLKSKKIILPIDWIAEDRKILDIGPLTTENFSGVIKKAETIVWNGPLGYIENPKFANGSKNIAKAIVKSGAFSVIGGGETTAFFLNTVNQRSVRVSPHIFLSTGGGAMLEFLAGKKLPGIEALNKIQNAKFKI